MQTEPRLSYHHLIQHITLRDQPFIQSMGWACRLFLGGGDVRILVFSRRHCMLSNVNFAPGGTDRGNLGWSGVTLSSFEGELDSHLISARVAPARVVRFARDWRRKLLSAGRGYQPDPVVSELYPGAFEWRRQKPLFPADGDQGYDAV